MSWRRVKDPPFTRRTILVVAVTKAPARAVTRSPRNGRNAYEVVG
jgi:hypothetical protein